MPNDKQNPNASDVLRALHALVHELEEDVARMPQKDVQDELMRRGISIQPLITDVKQQLAKAKANSELAAARSKREIALVNRLKLIQCKIKEVPEATRRRLLALLAEEDPAVAFSKFEAATDADLQSLLDDLDLLDKPNGEDPTDEG